MTPGSRRSVDGVSSTSAVLASSRGGSMKADKSIVSQYNAHVSASVSASDCLSSPPETRQQGM